MTCGGSRKVRAGAGAACPAASRLRCPPGIHRLALAAILFLGACGGNVITDWSTSWVDIRPNPTPLNRAQAECRQRASLPGAHGEDFVFCMQRHGWVDMTDPVLD